MIRLSPGVAQGCFELLEIVSRNPLTFREMHASFVSVGGISTAIVAETAQSLQWLHANEDGGAVLTATGSLLLAVAGYPAKLRRAIADYIEIIHPPWAQNAMFGRSRVLAFAGVEIAQLFTEAGLVDGTEKDVVEFWDALAARARGQRMDRLTEIGREGERLTMAYEESRTATKPKWVAIDNSADGYDVLSVVAIHDARPLSIEVKASTLGLTGSFHLSRHEWDRCTETDNHMFHLWAITGESSAALAEISPSDMQAHMPQDIGDGAWEIVEVPFSAFESNFRPIPTPGIRR